MNWYKRSQNTKEEQWQWDENTMYDYYDTQDETMIGQVQDFNDSKPGERQYWKLIPAGRLKKIWMDTAQMGFVRDVKGLKMIEDIVIENVRKIQSNTVLMGHTTHDPVRMLEDYEMTIFEDEGHGGLSDIAFRIRTFELLVDFLDRKL